MSSRSLSDLTPSVRALALAFIAECERRGLRVLIYCTLRSNDEQQSLYEQGRTKPGHIVTNAKPGQSMHNPDKTGKSRAFDAVPVNKSGVAQWADLSSIEKMGEAGEAVGLEWAGRWRGSLHEMVHFQKKGD